MKLGLGIMLAASRFVFIAMVLLVGCGPSDAAPASTDAPSLTGSEAPEHCEDTDAGLVDADEVEVLGDLDADQHRRVTWALERMAAAELKMPAEIVVTFDPTKTACGGAMGLCEPTLVPPVAHICVADNDQVNDTSWSRTDVIILHELAHIWRRSSEANLDFQSIVGGVEQASRDVIWSQRTDERVATVIGWGLLDTVKRPRLTAVPCIDMYSQFTELTGVAPLEPIPEECRP